MGCHDGDNYWRGPWKYCLIVLNRDLYRMARCDSFHPLESNQSSTEASSNRLGLSMWPLCRGISLRPLHTPKQNICVNFEETKMVILEVRFRYSYFDICHATLAQNSPALRQKATRQPKGNIVTDIHHPGRFPDHSQIQSFKKGQLSIDVCRFVAWTACFNECGVVEGPIQL